MICIVSEDLPGEAAHTAAHKADVGGVDGDDFFVGMGANERNHALIVRGAKNGRIDILIAHGCIQVNSAC